MAWLSLDVTIFRLPFGAGLRPVIAGQRHIGRAAIGVDFRDQRKSAASGNRAGINSYAAAGSSLSRSHRLLPQTGQKARSAKGVEA
jgi:hypothetical protein